MFATNDSKEASANGSERISGIKGLVAPVPAFLGGLPPFAKVSVDKLRLCGDAISGLAQIRIFSANAKIKRGNSSFGFRHSCSVLEPLKFTER